MSSQATKCHFCIKSDKCFLFNKSCLPKDLMYVVLCYVRPDIQTDADLRYFGHFPFTYLNLGTIKSKFTWKDFRDRKITESGLKCLSKLPIRHLNIQNIMITDHDIDHLSKLPIQSLMIYIPMMIVNSRYISKRPLITDTGFEHLSKSSITDLYIHSYGLSCQVTDIGYLHLSKLSLNHLTLDDIIITDVGLKHLSKSPLKTLTIRDQCGVITDTGLEHLKKSSIVELIIEIQECKITDVGLSHLSETKLTKLHIVSQDCNITDAGMLHLLKLPLIEVKITGCHLSSVTLKHLKQIKSLKKIITDI